MNRWIVVGATLVGATITSAQVVFVPAQPVFVPAPVVPLATPMAFYPPPAATTTTTQKPRTDAPTHSPRRIVHERHYIPRNTNISMYMAEQKPTQYGPDVAVIVRDFYFTDEVKRPAPQESTQQPPPKSSTENSVGDMLRGLDDQGTKDKTIPVPKAEEADKNGATKNGAGSSTAERSYPPDGAEAKQPESDAPATPPPSNGLTARWQIVKGTVQSNRGGTALAEMKLDFVNVDAGHADFTSTTDGNGAFEARLEPGKWQVYLRFADGSRKSLGVFDVKSGDETPVNLKF